MGRNSILVDKIHTLLSKAQAQSMLVYKRNTSSFIPHHNSIYGQFFASPIFASIKEVLKYATSPYTPYCPCCNGEENLYLIH